MVSENGQGPQVPKRDNGAQQKVLSVSFTNRLSTMKTVEELKREKQLLETQNRKIDYLIEKIQQNCKHDYEPGERSSIDYFSEKCTICDKVRWY